MDPSSDSKSRELQAEIDRLADQLGVHPIRVGLPLRTTDDINIFVDDNGTCHFAYYERGKAGFDRTGDLDDILYWYCEDIVSGEANRKFSNRRLWFAEAYRILNQFNPNWGKRYVRDLAEFFRRIQKPQDIALLPDIGEPL
jgi:hypothetical protein